MQLFSKILGSGPPVLILHGLFGMSDNWMVIAKALAEAGFSVHLLDLRNHGRSPHEPTHRYPDMCDDLLCYLQQQELHKISIIGHSMGGKLAMMFALQDPERLKKLVVVDIAPSDYRNLGSTFHSDVVSALLQIDLRGTPRRAKIVDELSSRLGDRELAMFLTKNLRRNKSTGSLEWILNLPVLEKYILHLSIGLEELELYAPCPVDTLFIKGNDSDYYLAEHEQDRHNFFPESKVVGVDGAGHWVHSQEPEKFLQIVTSFLHQ